MKINIIVAADEQSGIGKNNSLPWHLSADLKHFKLLTSGHSIIMGRKTYESIGKPLANRRNIVVTRQNDFQLAGTQVVNSFEDALEICKSEEEVFVIGGAELFKQAIPQARIIYLTRIHHAFDADTFLQDIDWNEWEEIERHLHQPDEKNPHAYTFITLNRK